MSRNIARGCVGVTATVLIIDVPPAGSASYPAHLPSYSGERDHQVSRHFWQLRVLTEINEGSGIRDHCHLQLNS
jgi:hypothetical protein